MASRSLTRRVVGAVLALELLGALSFSGLALWHERTTRLHAFDAQMQGRSDSLLGAIQDAEDPEDNVKVDPAELPLPGADVYAVYQQGGRLLGESPDAARSLILRSGDGYRTVRLGRRAYRVFEREALRVIDREESGGVGLKRPVTIVYAAPLDHVWHEVFEAATFYGVASLLVAACTALILVVLVRGFLRPIQALAAAASEVSPTSLSFIAPREALAVRELRPLAETLSDVVARLASAFEKQHRFVGDAAHELKTAVAVARSSIQLLDMRPRSPEQYQVGLQRILADNERTEELVARMLTLARIEERSEGEGASLPALDLGEGVERMLDSLAPYALERKIRLESRTKEQVLVQLAPDALQTLVSNLVINAVQHSPAGSAVFVRVDWASGPTKMAVLEVEDHGSGIEEKDQPFIFDRFYRDDVSRSRETGGAGLGLSICKSIVEAAGGAIMLKSAVGQGTTVLVTFMLA